MTERAIVLVIDDEVRSQETLKRILDEDFEVLTASNADEARQILEAEMVHILLCDQRMPGMSGVEFLKEARDRWPDPVRMIISGYTDSEDIIAGLNEAGIYQYITKPWNPLELLETVKKAVELFDLQNEALSASLEVKASTETLKEHVAATKSVLKTRFTFDRILHDKSSRFAETIDQAKRVAGLDISVLITGESGTGKELLARAIHYASPWADKPFVVENCGALPDELLESELFGCKKGAFTGAYEDRIGLFEKANGGTIFLDEIGETSPSFQVKLLRVLQEGEFRPLGARMTRKVQVRVIAATNRDLLTEVNENRFRRDLYYRLATFPLHLPALRERPEDIPVLCRHLLKKANQRFGKRLTGFTKQAMAVMEGYAWPGNVREMENVIQRIAALVDDGDIDTANLSPELLAPRAPDVAGQEIRLTNPGGSLKEQVESLEEKIIRDRLRRYNWNISRVASDLGLSRVGLRNKIERYGVMRHDIQ